MICLCVWVVVDVVCELIDLWDVYGLFIGVV